MYQQIPSTKFCPDCGYDLRIEEFGRKWADRVWPRQGYCKKHDYARVKQSESKPQSQRRPKKTK